MDIKRYEAFLKIVDCGSVTKAAELLGYSQPGLSHMLSSLESEFGVSLIVRNQSGLSLTSDGLSLLPRIREVINAKNELESAANELHGMQSGLIRIGVFASVAINWLPQILRGFHAQYPNIDIELVFGCYSSIREWIMNGRIDCGFLRYPLKSNLDCIVTSEDEMIVITPEDHLCARQKSFPVEKLADDNFILLEEGAENEVLEILDDLNVKPKIRIRASLNQAVAAMVECGFGISILPELALRRAPFKIAKLPLSKPRRRTLCLAMRSIKHTPIALQHLLNYIKLHNVIDATKL